MPCVTTPSHLAANLSCLGERNADLAEKLASVSPHAGLLFCDSGQSVPSATLDGAQLCSRHRPLDEAQRLVAEIDLIEHAVVVVLGFGLGYHVQKLAQRAAKATLIIVFEPDLRLLCSVLEQIDHSQWMREALLVFITDPEDRGALGKKLEGADAILAQGLHFLEHPASRTRLHEAASRFSKTLSDYVSTARTTLLTTLMRSVDTVRNLMLNLDHYAAGPGIDDLAGAVTGFPAIVVSAGPSLHRNMHLLAEPGIRDRCVIIAVQTTLKPLLDAGIKPHFVTALDYHEISRRFYEGIDPDQVRDVTLIAEPKAHPVILDAFAGPVRCCANGFLDKLLGPMQRQMGTVPAGATVAHLAVFFARYLGCNPIAMIGQDLGFTDGLYYAPGTAIHDVWAPELNSFNTIEMMEWQRITRHRLHLHKVRDVHGRSIYTDAQMHTYLQQFEREFAQFKSEGLTIIDATEGGVAKQHTIAMPLHEVLDQYAGGGRPLPPLPLPADKSDPQRLRAAQQRLAQVRRDIRRLKQLSTRTAELIRQMIQDQANLPKMAQHFQKIEQHRKEVEQRFEAFELLNQLNQVGVFNRMKADRRLHMQRDLSALARQRGQLERDLTNVVWIADAAQEMLDLLDSSERVLAGEKVESRTKPAADLLEPTADAAPALRTRIAALVPIDPRRNGLGIERSLAELFHGRTVLQATLERLGQSQQLESIILIAPPARDFDIEALIDRSRIGLPVEIERVEGSPFGPEHRAIIAARLWADTCWRGGIAGMSVYDEVLCPQVMHEIMQRRGLTAAILVGPDWPLVQVTGPAGCDAIAARHRENPHPPHAHNIVFTQAPPGLGGCLVSAALMQELSQRNRLSTIGGLLVYQPHAPQGDPIAREVNVQIDHKVRQSLIRATFDTPRQRELINRAMQEIADAPASPAAIVAAIERATAACGLARSPSHSPHHIILELCTDRTSRGLFRRHPVGPVTRPPLGLDQAERIFDQAAAFKANDLVLTLDGVGDPLLHPQFDEIIHMARQRGFRGVQVRTELLTDGASLDRLLASGVDVVSVDLNADRAATYQTMMGLDRFKDVLLNIEYLLQNRVRFTPQAGGAALALPWVVPHLQRCAETYEDIDTFFDRWQHMLGTAVIEGAPPFTTDSLAPAVTPRRVVERDRNRRMTIFCDGSVPIDEWDWPCADSAGNVATIPLVELWQTVLQRRRSIGTISAGELS